MLDIAIRHQQGGFSLEAVLQIGEGLTALFGPSGSGKTTLINLVAGLVRPEQGQIRLSGETWSDSDHGVFLPAHRRRIGYVFQEPRLFPHMTVRQNLAYGERLLPRTERRESLPRIADLLHLSPLLDRRPQHLSGGEKQRVSIARALAGSPSVILADEPTAALDAKNGLAVMELLAKVAQDTRRAVLAVTHDHRTLPYADRIITIDDGRIAGSERPKLTEKAVEMAAH